MKKIVFILGCLFPVAANSMADSTPPVYGRPTLYGEYEISAADARVAAKMYGATPKNPVAKMPVKPKAVIAKKNVKKKKVQKKTGAKKSAAPRAVTAVVEKIEEAPIVVPDVVQAPPPAKKEVAPAMPSAEALVIAEAARPMRDENSYCIRRASQGKGKLPEGFVLMPGRPDLMSCGDKD